MYNIALFTNKVIVDYNKSFVPMSFSERLKLIQNLMLEDTERCLQIISNKSFISSIFSQELKAFVNMFEAILIKKLAVSKNLVQEKTGLRPQIVIAFYSIIILRESSINIRHESISTIATRYNNLSQSVYNSKLANETLTKIYKSLEENDQTRQIVTGLLLKINGFNNYKMIVRDLNPAFVSDQTMSTHFQALKSQCPNLLETQLVRYKTKWFKYLRYKPIELQSLSKLLGNLITSQQEQSISFWDQIMLDIQNETSYLLNRLSIINNGEQLQRINLDELIKLMDEIYVKLMQRIKQTALVSKKSSKNEHLNPEYDFKQFVHKNYLKFMLSLLKIVNSLITNIGINWLRRVKWLYNFVLDLFIGFNIKSNQFHQSIAQQYSNILLLIIKIVTNFFLTFKTGLFPQGKLLDITFSQEYSFSKLIQAILYNEYPFNESEIVQFQNYQKQRNNHENKNKQAVIDIVNFNMKSLNINPHWDNLFMKIIPNLKNSVKFAKEILNQTLYFILRYYELSQNFQGAAKFLLLLQNAKNAFFINDPVIKRLIGQIKSSIYPEKKEVREGIEYFCQEYFAEYLKIGKRREEEQLIQRRNNKHLHVCSLQAINITSQPTTINKLKKTQSREAIIQGWDNFQSVKDSGKDSVFDLKASINRGPMVQSAEMINNQLFYSVTQKDQKLVDGKQNKQMEEEAKQIEEQILLPDF